MNVTGAQGINSYSFGNLGYGGRPVQPSGGNLPAMQTPNNIPQSWGLRCQITVETLARTIPPSASQIQEMSVDETVYWINNLGKLLHWGYRDTCDIAKVFRQEKIDGSKIVKFENTDLKKIKVKKLGHRLAILKAVRSLYSLVTVVKEVTSVKVNIMEKFLAQFSDSDHEPVDLFSCKSVPVLQFGKEDRKKSGGNGHHPAHSDYC